MVYTAFCTELEMVYLDHNATTPMLPEVVEAMNGWFGVPANPASIHSHGQRAVVAVEEAREQVAALVGGNPAGVVFTSGATEANHLCIRGAWLGREAREVVVLSPIEHPCVRDAADRLSGAKLRLMAVDKQGCCSVGEIDESVALVSLMAVNHETGAVQPFAEAIRLGRNVGAFVHVDATQGAGRIPLDLSAADGVVLSSHKLGGPGGVGALILGSGDSFPALVGGGAQERGRRAGTVNTAGVVGFGQACLAARRDLEERRALWKVLSEQVRASIRELGGQIIGDHLSTVPNTICSVFGGLTGEGIVQGMDLHGVSVSSGAACSSGSVEASPVLQAMGVEHPSGSLRVSLGWNTAQGDIAAFNVALRDVVGALRVLDDDWDA
jgi:cysteine desulfurase